MSATCRWLVISVLSFAVFSAAVGHARGFAYRDPEGRFWCSLEGAWRAADVEPGAEAIAHLLHEEAGTVIAEVLVTQTLAEQGETFEALIRSEHRRLQALEGVRIVSRESDLRLGGQRAVRWVLEVTAMTRGQRSKRVVSQYVVQRGATLWGLTVIARPAHRATLVAIDAMLSDGFHFGQAEEAAAPSAQAKGYVDPLGRFAIDPAQGWLSTASGDNRVIFDAEGTRLTISVSRGCEWTSAREAATVFLEKRSAMTGVKVIAEGASESLAGAYAIEYTGERGGVLWRVHLLALLDADSLYFVHAICPETQWNTQRERLLAAQRSFVLLAPAASLAGSSSAAANDATQAEAETAEPSAQPAGKPEEDPTGTLPSEEDSERPGPIWSPKWRANVPG